MAHNWRSAQCGLQVLLVQASLPPVSQSFAYPEQDSLRIGKLTFVPVLEFGNTLHSKSACRSEEKAIFTSIELPRYASRPHAPRISSTTRTLNSVEICLERSRSAWLFRRPRVSTP